MLAHMDRQEPTDLRQAPLCSTGDPQESYLCMQGMGKRPIAQLKPQIPKQLGPPLPPSDPNTVICYTDAARKAAGLAWIFTDYTSKEIT
ncbi:hypothetical protein F2Q68_00043188 [Brassica cretica]|uniref:Uncharacterized protein n=2 Tax=Brassica cretica TaxID=69181 RepID=A0A8S9LV31_BRACR|nr:hypothetical protein F2Q68_00043188 [Brassica cretica]